MSKPPLNKSRHKRLRGNRRLGQLCRFIHQKDTRGLDISKKNKQRGGIEKDKYLKDKLTPSQIERINASEDYLMKQIDTDNDIEVEKLSAIPIYLNYFTH